MVIADTLKPAVSVLVPIYNAEEYLAQCLNALCSQTLRNIEIICINDGSTDGSLALLQDYAAKDGRVQVIDKPNSGYGGAMNRGIQQAQGEYIGVVEPDDFPEKTMFKTLYNAASRYDCDLAKSNFFEHCENKDYPIPNLHGFPYKTCFSPAEKPSIICTIPSIWTGLYKRAMLEAHQVRFRETSGASFQDTSFVLKTWFAADSCILVRKPLLHYRVDNPGSSVKTSDKVFTVCEELAESERFLRSLPEKAAAFIGWFHADKLGKYRWNYERIASTERLVFTQCMFEEFTTANAADELQEICFSPHDWTVVRQLLEQGPEAFVRAHEESF